MSQASRALAGVALLTLAGAPGGCVVWPGYGGNDCGADTVEIAPGEVEAELDPWQLAEPYEGACEASLRWELVGRTTTVWITLARREANAVAHRDCEGWESWDGVDVPMTFWLRTEDGALDVVYEGLLPLTNGGLLRESLHQFDVPPEALPLEHLVPPDLLPVNDPIASVRLDLRFNTSRHDLELTSGDLVVEYQYRYRTEDIASLAPAE